MRDDFDFDEYNLSGGSESNDFGGFVSDSDFERAFFSEDALDKDQGVTPDQVPRDQVTGMPVNSEAKGYPNSGSRPKTEDRVVHKSQEIGMRDPRLKHHSRNQVRPRNQAGNPRPQVKQSSNNIPNSTPSIQSSNVQGSMRGENVNTSDKPSKSGKKSKGGKKKSKLPLVIVPIVAVAVIAGVFLSGNKLEPQIEVYETTGRYAYDALQSALQSYDAETLDDVVGTEDGDSYLSQEWSYANNNEIRESFIKTVCANTSFKYPQVPQLSTTGKEMTQDGNPILVTSSMNNGEKVTVSHIDYTALSETMKEDKELILEMYNNAGISDKDYDFSDSVTDLMLDYITSKGSLPLTDTEISLGVVIGTSPYIADDTNLDKLLFSSDEFHNMCDVFSQVVTGFTGYTTEKYTEKEEQVNPEYAQWKIRFDKYYKADKGKFVKGVSKWEPWYLRDKNNNYVLDENGDRVVNYYSIKDDQGNDWIQPNKTILVDVEKERQVEVEWDKDSVIPYCFLGAYYCQNDYEGDFSPDVRVGDGTVENPAGVGTSIITKALGTDGKYHDVRVTMTGYWTGEDAINYAVSFSEKNRGFDINSVIQLICYEIKVENLENKAFTFESDMFLADVNSNKSTRTGTMYGFQSKKTVKAGESVIINDWATSTELDQKYVCWGSSFNRMYNTVYFKVLAGKGEIPTYSAYKAFTGESSIDEKEGDTITEEAPDNLVNSNESSTDEGTYN